MNRHYHVIRKASLGMQQYCNIALFAVPVIMDMSCRCELSIRNSSPVAIDKTVIESFNNNIRTKSDTRFFIVPNLIALRAFSHITCNGWETVVRSLAKEIPDSASISCLCVKDIPYFHLNGIRLREYFPYKIDAQYLTKCLRFVFGLMVYADNVEYSRLFGEDLGDTIVTWMTDFRHALDASVRRLYWASISDVLLPANPVHFSNQVWVEFDNAFEDNESQDAVGLLAQQGFIARRPFKYKMIWH